MAASSPRCLSLRGRTDYVHFSYLDYPGWSKWGELHTRPRDPKSRALLTELHLVLCASRLDYLVVYINQHGGQFSAGIVILSEVLRGRSDHPGATRPLERVTGYDPAAFCLEGRCSTD